jgi:hypothetical protein
VKKKIGIIAALSMLLVALSAAVASANFTPGDQFTGTLNTANAPSGTHLANGSATPTCTIGSDGLTVTCNAYTLGGVGHTNADLVLTADYTVTVQCTNHGRQIVEAQQKTATAPGKTTVTSSKNGQLAVPERSVSPSSFSGNPCPNPNWTATVLSTKLNSFDYTLTFDGFSSPAIEITATDP